MKTKSLPEYTFWSPSDLNIGSPTHVKVATCRKVRSWRKVKIITKWLLMLSSVFSLTVGLALIVSGVVFRFWADYFIAMFTDHLDNELDRNVCVEPSSGIDFCSHQVDVSKVDFGEWVQGLGYLLTIVGFMICLFSIVGFIGACCRMKPTLYLTIALACACIGGEVLFMKTIMDEDSSLHVEAQTELVDLLQQEYLLAEPYHDSFTEALNLIMLSGECCGITGREDFGINLTFTRADGFNYNFIYPPACTKRHLLQLDKFESFSRCFNCRAPPPSHLSDTRINSEGCYNTVFNYISAVYGTIVISTYISLIALHCVAIVLAALILTPLPKTAARFTNSLYELTDLQPKISQGALLPDEPKGLNLEARIGISKSGSTAVW